MFLQQPEIEFSEGLIETGQTVGSGTAFEQVGQEVVEPDFSIFQVFPAGCIPDAHTVRFHANRHSFLAALDQGEANAKNERDGFRQRQFIEEVIQYSGSVAQAADNVALEISVCRTGRGGFQIEVRAGRGWIGILWAEKGAIAR